MSGDEAIRAIWGPWGQACQIEVAKPPDPRQVNYLAGASAVAPELGRALQVGRLEA